MTQGLTRELMAIRVAREFKEGMYINLGAGLPTTVANYVPQDIEVVLHSENGILNYGRMPPDDKDWDLDLINAGGQPTSLKPGACFFDSSAAFGMIRGGYIDISVLGAYQVSEKGDIANWAVGEEITGVGGAMDLCCGVKRLFVIMEHTTKKGMPRIVCRCTYPLTAEGVVSTIFTNLAVIDVTPKGLVLREVAPGISPEAVQNSTETKLTINPDIKEMLF
jgi:3-oxoacid CoA-transferase B subunit